MLAIEIQQQQAGDSDFPGRLGQTPVRKTDAAK
jgi:hypothetical protein